MKSKDAWPAAMPFDFAQGERGESDRSSPLCPGTSPILLPSRTREGESRPILLRPILLPSRLREGLGEGAQLNAPSRVPLPPTPSRTREGESRPILLPRGSPARFVSPPACGRGWGRVAQRRRCPCRCARRARVQPLDPRLLHFARGLRAHSTDAERILWALLRNKRLAGLKFRRQHPFGFYVLDFYCSAARLAIELDGGHHWTEDEQRRDAQRARYLREHRIEILRFSNREVVGETERVLEAIWQRLAERQLPGSRRAGRRSFLLWWTRPGQSGRLTGEAARRRWRCRRPTRS
ncbi:MAG: DUF559 domain-containing protein [Sandaracinaceae bacterium]|nr:DUF559 domain-containing protein [Sandaracinaceae bacterium]